MEKWRLSKRLIAIMKLLENRQYANRSSHTTHGKNEFVFTVAVNSRLLLIGVLADKNLLKPSPLNGKTRACLHELRQLNSLHFSFV